eukprot:COSAG05_NODE_2620_length_2831_cov_3.267577_1_plen_262_part_00
MSNIPDDAEPEWFLGTGDGTQSCNTVCEEVAVNMCGPDRGQPCAMKPVCMRQALEDFFLDQTCAAATAARTSAGAMAWTSCVTCSPTNYCETSVCMYCAPGILGTGSTSYYGGSVDSPDVCNNVYLDDRIQPLCPCFVTETSSLGWVISGVILGLVAIYFGGGVYYGRRSKPPAPGDGALAHPEGKSVIGWHPHWEQMQQVPALLEDGWRYSKMLLSVTTKRDWELENYHRGQYLLLPPPPMAHDHFPAYTDPDLAVTRLD